MPGALTPTITGMRPATRRRTRSANCADSSGEDRHAVAADAQVVVGHAVGRLEVERAIVREGRRGDDVDALGAFVEETGHDRDP